MKSLVGSWEGTMDMGEGPMKIDASYKLTSGGSAIVETIFERSPHEMVTIYHDNSERDLTVTHYCMLHNQPKLELKELEEHEIEFDLAEDADIDVAAEEHMHALTIKFKGEDKMTQHWTKYEEGEPQMVTEIAYTRLDAE